MTRRTHTPVPPLNCLLLHSVDLRLPSCQRKITAPNLILQVLLEDEAGIVGGDVVRIVERVQQSAVVISSVLVVGDDRSIVGVGVVQPVLLHSRQC